MRETEYVFVTMWHGSAIKVPLLQHETGEVIPEGYLERDEEIVRRWLDYKLAMQLRQSGVPVVSPSLLMAGIVIQSRSAA